MDEFDDILGEMDSLLVPEILKQEDAKIPIRQEEDADQEDAPLINFSETDCLWHPSIQPPPLPLSFLSTSQKKSPMFNFTLPSLEVHRLKAISSLWDWLKTTTTKQGYDVHTPTFERWLLTTRHCQEQKERKLKPSARIVSPDPVLAAFPTSTESVLLGQELCEAGCSVEHAHALVEELCQRTRQAHQLLSHTPRKHNQGKVPFIKITPENASNSSTNSNPLLLIESQNIVGRINEAHFIKLCQLWEVHSNKKEKSKEIDAIDKLVAQRERDVTILCTLLRYNALSGGSKDGSGGGFQGALHEGLFKTLHEKLNCRFECFASPLNCAFSRYCSAFPDVDRYFGSIGSFFDFFPQEGCFEANPPFVPVMVEDMARHITHLLERSCRKAVRRRVAVPNASGPGWKLLRQNKFLVKHIKFAAQEHGYCEGSQHVRCTRFKTSRFESSLFVLQNDAAKEVWPVTEEICDEIRSAFASRFEEELTSRTSTSSLTKDGKRRTKKRNTKDDDDDDPSQKNKRKKDCDTTVPIQTRINKMVHKGNSKKLVVADEVTKPQHSNFKRG